jgi:hypothetical protein
VGKRLAAARASPPGLARTWGAAAKAARRGCSSSRWSGPPSALVLLPVRTAAHQLPSSRVCLAAPSYNHKNMVRTRGGQEARALLKSETSLSLQTDIHL